jgi:LPXTG-motif cell wall-anchored protein
VVIVYHKGVLAGGAGTALGTLPYTGLNLTWVVLAGFALLMAAGAVWRIVPRTQA